MMSISPDLGQPPYAEAVGIIQKAGHVPRPEGSFREASTCEIWPFDKDFFLIFNLAFGGDWGGARGTDDSYFPVEYQVDYVRVYQSPEILELTGQ